MPLSRILTTQLCLFTPFAKINFSRKFPNLQSPLDNGGSVEGALKQSEIMSLLYSCALGNFACFHYP